MAPLFLQGLQKFRFLLVGALVLAFLSTPFITQAGSKQTSTVTVLEASDTLAGLSTEIVLQGKNYKTLEVALQKPDGTVLILETVTNGKGEASLMVSDYHLRSAGLYEVAAREAGSNQAYGTSSNFEIFPGTVSETKSQVDFNKQSAALGETIEMTVSLLDSYGNEIDGHVLKVAPSSPNVSVYSPDFATDEDGHMNFYITSQSKGVYSFTVFDSSVNKTLTSQSSLAFSGTGSYADAGGHNTNVILSAESGEMDSFILDGLDEEAVVGDSQSLTVKAVDADGFTVPDYTGTIHFSSSDNSATLPNDYSFIADDQGEHTFSLSVKFVTPGEQTVTVTDIDEFSLEGEATTEVITTEDSGVDYDGDFESTDFERDGDFTLISPAEGSYSSDSVEVQGEAEYGYTAVIYLSEDEVGRVDVDFDNSFTYTVEDIADGTYDLYVDVVELGDGEEGEEEILSVHETSDSEKITIDTTAPELISISSEPEEALVPGDSVTITVLSESDLEEASVIFQEEVYTMEESSTSGKYEVELIMPETAGDYTVDVILMDTLGNEVEYKDQLTISLGEAVVIEEEPVVVEEPEPAIGTVSGLTASSAPETVLLSWEPAESTQTLAFYRVYYGPSAESLYAISETYDASTNWSIVDLSGEERYYFAVSAVDIEGTEGELSDVVMGIPELSRVVEIDVIDDTSVVPAITGNEDDIASTPDSGPAQTALFVLSALGALAYLQMRKRAVRQTF
ncbi:MAG: fibronectin type III domain-containing protein [Patescibacteria group bacterium]